MLRTNVRWIIPALVLTLGITGCDDGEPTTPDTPPTSLTVMLTDAVGDVEAVWIEIIGLYLQGEGGREHLPYESNGLINITDLFGIAMPLIEGAPMESGPHGQLRIVIGDAVLLAEGGEMYKKGNPETPLLPEGFQDPGVYGDLHCPSCSQSGIKVKLAGEEVELPEGEAVMVLDFNVAESFGHAAGKSGKWVMHPTIHAVLEEGVEVPGGAIEGMVRLSETSPPPECPAGMAWGLDDFVPVATATTLLDGANQPIERSGTTAGDGTFGIGPLDPDVYTLGFLAEVNLTTHLLEFTEVDPQPPAQADVQGAVVGGFEYVINAWTCTETTTP